MIFYKSHLNMKNCIIEKWAITLIQFEGNNLILCNILAFTYFSLN